jgi:NTP pyrophosphatase (non-canonical NTP hydrolase)
MNLSISFKEAIDLAKRIIKRFEKIEGKPWKVEGAMIELSKQVGELAKLVMVYEKYYFSDISESGKGYEADKKKIGDELADILYAIIRIANYYKIDLVEAHIRARQAEDNLLKSKGV